MCHASWRLILQFMTIEYNMSGGQCTALVNFNDASSWSH